ncbi:MAG: hypothetical protein GF398_18235 [Chitinivibrionales bacterium]|nr:hypothetical protein [Chitinivibrionales bacterium]
MGADKKKSGTKGKSRKLDPELPLSEKIASIFASKSLKYSFFDQKQFNIHLKRETKRCERFSKAAVLLRIDVTSLIKKCEQTDAVERLSALALIKKCINILFSNTRDIDLKGWYREGHEIGVLLIDIEVPNKDDIAEKMGAKLFKSLNSELDDDIIVNTEVIAH